MMKFLTGKKILIISPEGWGKSFLSKHHYAISLIAAGNKVWFLNPPGRQKKSNEGELAEVQHNSQLTILEDIPFRGLRFMPELLQRSMMKKLAKKIESRAGTTFDIVWSFDNSRYFHLDSFSSAYTIHHMVDLEMDFHLEAACNSAQICLGVSYSMVSAIKKYCSNSHFIDHGSFDVNTKHMTLPGNANKIRAAYIGNLLMEYFDAYYLKNLISSHPEVDFILIGSRKKGNLNLHLPEERLELLQSIEEYSNAFFTEEVTPEEAFSMAEQSDVLLVTYFNYPGKLGNSSKLPGYLAAGKVIITSEIEVYENSSLMRICKTRDDFNQIFNDTILHIDQWNSKEKIELRKAHARSNSYSSQLEKIDALICANVK
jgi:hypothetical protein